MYLGLDVETSGSARSQAIRSGDIIGASGASCGVFQFDSILKQQDSVACIEPFETALMNSRRSASIMREAMRLLFLMRGHAIVIIAIFKLLTRTRQTGTFLALCGADVTR